MIPKIIHYVWVGDEPKSELIKECIATWRKHLPGFKIIEWNEHNFDMHENSYIEQAYAARKWAFVSDYIRVRALYEHGGIYLDTDVRVLADLSPLLKDRAFIGFENSNYLSAAIFGAEKRHPLLKDMLNYYAGRNFSFDRQHQMAGVNSLSVTKIVQADFALQLGNKEQLLKNGLRVYPDGVLCNPSRQSRTIHLFTGTWMNGQKSYRHKLVVWLKQHINTPKEAGLYERLFR